MKEEAQPDTRWELFEALLANGRQSAEEGRIEDARTLFEQASREAAAKETMESPVPDAQMQTSGEWRTAQALYHIAYYVHLNENNLKEAGETFEKALSLYETSSDLADGERQNEMQACLEGLAGIAFKNGEKDAAASYALRILSTCPELGSRNHAAIQMIILLARELVQNDSLEKACDLCQKTLPLAEQIYGPSAHQLVRLLETFAAIKQNSGKEAEAEAQALLARAEKIKAAIPRPHDSKKPD